MLRSAMEHYRPWTVSRRNVIKAGAALAATLAQRRAGPAEAASGPSPVSMAMHLHSSYSEGAASMRWHMAQAAAAGVDVVWISDHDWRMAAYRFLRSMSLTSLTEEGPTGTVRLVRTAGDGGGVSAFGLDVGGATWQLDDTAARQVTSGSLARLTITVDADPRGELALVVVGSQDALGRAPTATKLITSPGTVSWRPATELAGGADNALARLCFGGNGTFRNLELDWGADGVDVLAEQRAAMAALPGPRRYQGLEVSWLSPHIGTYGGALAIPDYASMTGPDDLPAVHRLVEAAHAAGSVVSFNHPFGTSLTSTNSALSADRFGRACASLVGAGLCGADLIEVAYPGRGYANIDDHLALWDGGLRNGLWLTGTGTSDDHGGTPWAAQQNRFVTVAWAGGGHESVLVGALRAGRVFARKLGTWNGTIALHLDGSCPMGSASVSSLDTRSLRVEVTAVPPGGRVNVVGGLVDHAATTPASSVLTSLPSSRAVLLDTRRDCFVRAEVLDGAGEVVGVSNPIWSFRATPPGGIPAQRAC